MQQQELIEALKQTLSDHRLSRSEKQGLKQLIGSAVNDQQKSAVIRAKIFDIAREEIASTESREVVDWLEGALKLLVPPPADRSAASKLQSEAFFSNQDQCADKIVKIIGRMRTSIDICVFTITDDRISNAIIDAHKRGVKIRIVTDDDKSRDLGSDVIRIIDANVPLRMDSSPDHMHHKYAIFDGAYLLTGSYNWTRGADQRNRENFIVTNDSGLLAEFKNHFEGIWSGYR